MTAPTDTPISSGRATVLIAGLVSIMPFATDAYLPALGAMADYLNTTVHQLEQSVGSFFLGAALGQLVGAPFSDQYGRKLPIMLGMLIYIAASLIIATSTSDSALIAWRFVQALGAGVAMVNAAAIVRDLFDEVETARLFANIAVVMMIAPLVSPLAGAYLLDSFGWPSIFVFLAFYGVVVIGSLWAFMPETRFLRKKPIAANGYRHVLSSRWSNALALSLAFSAGCFFLYLADASYIFLQFYGQTPKAFAWLFSFGVIMLVGAHRINHWLLVRYKPRRIMMYCVPVQTASAAAVLAYALSGAGNMWIMYLLIMMVGSVTQIMSSNGLAIYLALHPDHAGKANAILGSMRFGMGGLLGFLLSAMHTESLVSFGLLVFISAALSMVLFIICRTQSDIFSRQNTT
ncbi:MAG: multidrug effflux MFS transporter [Gammaproteobacteria bacterium]